MNKIRVFFLKYRQKDAKSRKTFEVTCKYSQKHPERLSVQNMKISDIFLYCIVLLSIGTIPSAKSCALGSSKTLFQPGSRANSAVAGRHGSPPSISGAFALEKNTEMKSVDKNTRKKKRGNENRR